MIIISFAGFPLPGIRKDAKPDLAEPPSRNICSDARLVAGIEEMYPRLIRLLTYEGTGKNGCQAKHSSTTTLEGNTDSEPERNI